MRQSLGIKHPAPWLKRPAADADKDLSGAIWYWFWSHLIVTERCYNVIVTGDGL